MTQKNLTPTNIKNLFVNPNPYIEIG